MNYDLVNTLFGWVLGLVVLLAIPAFVYMEYLAYRKSLGDKK